MIIDFKFTNYRSYIDKGSFSMQAEATKSKSSNILEFENTAGQQFKLLKAAVVYGPNASGKSNLIKAILDVIDFILYRPIVDSPIQLYNPFKFERQTKGHPSSFELTFIGPERVKYILKFKIQKDKVLSESLEYYPNNRKSNVYLRSEDSAENKVKENDNATVIIKYKNKEFIIFKNQLFLSRFAEEPDNILTPVYQYFRNNYDSSLKRNNAPIHEEITKKLLEDNLLKKQVSNLITAIDTKIKEITIEDRYAKERISAKLAIDPENIIHAEHDLYEDGILKGSKELLTLSEESQGTQALYILGARILNAINNGSVLIIDEFDTSLHPLVTRFLLTLFLSTYNDKGAQLIFSTHDISLLEKHLLRRDQIWFTEKKDNGGSELYCLQDFEGIREDISFEKWYMAGKFGALPNLHHIDSVFE